MMFLQFFIWGLWFVTMGFHLLTNVNSSNEEVGMAYGAQALGAMVAPFVIGMVADKYFSAQKILGCIHLVGAVLLYLLSLQSNFQYFYVLLLAYFVLYMPTLALVNSIAMNKMNNPTKEFAGIRVWGTIGWIAAGLLVGYFRFEHTQSLDTNFKLASSFSVLLGIYSFSLPNTPPQLREQHKTWRKLMGIDALRILKSKNYLVFFISSVLICIPLAFYYQETNIFLNELKIEQAAGKMSMGQMSEILLLFAMPFFFRFLNIKKMLLIGMIAWTLRYVLFAYGDNDANLWMLYVGIILHGVCYDFFFVTGQIYTDQQSPITLRSSSQGMITLATYGIGMFIGFIVAGSIAAAFQTDDGHEWKYIWMIPAIIAALIAVFFALLFKDSKKHIANTDSLKNVL